MAKNYPGWTIVDGWTGPDTPRKPAVASGDFNGDGSKDNVVAVKKDDRIYSIVFFVTDKSINAVTLEAQKESDNAWVANVGDWAKGKRVFGRDDRNEERDMILEMDAVALIDGEGHTTLYYWKGGKFLKLFGADEAAGSSDEGSAMSNENDFDNAVKIDARIKTVGLFSSYEDMAKSLGKPLSEKKHRPEFSECSGETESFMDVKYSGLEIQLDGDKRGRNFDIVSYQVKSGSWDVQGIKIGSTQEEVQRKFGKPFRTLEKGELTDGQESGVVYLVKIGETTVGEGSATFRFRNGKVESFSAGVDLC